MSTPTSSHFKKPPLVIDGSRVLYYSRMGSSVGYSGDGLIFIGRRELGRVPRLVIAQPLRQSGFQIFHCDKNWRALAHDGGHASTKDAKRRAERIYPGITPTWIKFNVSKHEALAIERTQWRGHECSFCNRIPPDFQRSLHGRKARICNICVDEIYRDFLELEQETSVMPPRGDYYAENALRHIGHYVPRLLVPTDRYKTLFVFALDGRRGCGVIAHGKIVQVSFVVESEREIARETSIRSFFASKGTRPASDYLANNGRTRILQFPITGNARELTKTVKAILEELCDISSKEALCIRYDER